MSNDPHCQQTPKFFTMILQGSDTLTHHILPSYLELHPPHPSHRRYTYVMLPLSELLWHHILHSPIPCFCRCALYLEGTPPIVPCPKSYFKPSPLQFLKQKSNCTPTWILSRTAFLRQISPLYDIYLCTCLTELRPASGRTRTASYPPVFPTTPTYLFWMEHMDLQCWWINKINLVIISF